MELITLRQWLTMLWLVWNIAVGLVYIWDKYRAIRGEWRVSEKTLLTITSIYGGTGAYVAALLCHHKTKKWYFHLAWWLGIVLSIGTFYLVFRYF